MLEWPGSPAGGILPSGLLAPLPALLLVVRILGFGWSAARAGPAGWLAAAGIARLSYGAGSEVLAVAQAKALFLAVDVLLIVWAAFLLCRVVDEAGGVATLAAALPRLTPDRGMQALLIGWAFASFLQGVGGFGVPVVVTAPILLGFGFDPGAAAVAPALGATQYALAVGGVWHIAGFGGGLAGLAVGFVLARSTRSPSGPSASEVVPVRLIVLALTGYARLVVITLAVQFIVPLRAALGSVVVQAQFPTVATGLGVLTPAEPGKSLVLLRHAGAILAYAAALTYFILLRARGV